MQILKSKLNYLAAQHEVSFELLETDTKIKVKFAHASIEDLTFEARVYRFHGRDFGGAGFNPNIDYLKIDVSELKKEITRATVPGNPVTTIRSRKKTDVINVVASVLFAMINSCGAHNMAFFFHKMDINE